MLEELLGESGDMAEMIISHIDKAIKAELKDAPPEGWSIRDKALQRVLTEIRVKADELRNMIAEIN